MNGHQRSRPEHSLLAIEIQRLRKRGPLTHDAFATAAADVRQRYERHDLELGVESRRRFAHEHPALGDRQREILQMLRTDGIAVVPFERLFDAVLWTELVADATVFEAGSKGTIARGSRLDRRLGAGLRRFAHRVIGRSPKDFDMFRAVRHGVRLSPDDRWLRTAVSPTMLDIANAYLGMWTKLSYLDRWHTPPRGVEAKPTRNHLWHRDYNDRRLLKIFMYMTNVDAESGMFEYVAGSMRASDIEQEDEWDPFADSRLPPNRQAALERDRAAHDIRSIAAPAGTVIFCDTSGLHRGGFATRRSRTIGTWTYVSPASLACIAPRNFTIDEAALPRDLPAQVRFALT